jgi:hypothetical protein
MLFKTIHAIHCTTPCEASSVMSSVAMSSDNQIAALQTRLVELQKARRAEQIDSDKRIAEAQSRNTLSAQVQTRLDRCEASLLTLLMEVKSWVRACFPTVK